MADAILLVLFVFHVGFIALWFGAASILSMILLPSLSKISQASRVEFIIQAIPRYARFIAITSSGSVAFGFLLFLYETQVATTFAPDNIGLEFIITGAGVGLVAYILAIGVAFPASNRLVIALREKTLSEVPRMQARIRRTSLTVTALLALTLVLMVLGANV